jgi:orotidine-5'-phosphate decarboxylase
MNVEKLALLIREQNNFLCVGLDPDLSKLPGHLPKNAEGVLQFNKEIIEATSPHCVSYKINFAFFEALGQAGWWALEETRKLLPSSHFLIADAKRGDIGNTAEKYAESIFGDLDFDAVTLNPYMGKDVADPFLKYPDKTVILLALTSNTGSEDFQLLKLDSGLHVFEEVVATSRNWADTHRIMYVVGATKPEYFLNIRDYAAHHFLLVPGVGAQGGDLKTVYQYGRNSQGGLLVNSSRGIIYAGSGEDFAEKAGEAAKTLCVQMNVLMSD